MVSKIENDVQLGLYTHFKGGRYEVLGVAQHSEGQEEMVVYRCLYGDFSLWVRPKSIFLSMVVLEGKSVRRFAYTGPQTSEVK